MDYGLYLRLVKVLAVVSWGAAVLVGVVFQQERLGLPWWALVLMVGFFVLPLVVVASTDPRRSAR